MNLSHDELRQVFHRMGEPRNPDELLRRIEIRAIVVLLEEMQNMSAAIDRLRASVTRLTSAHDAFAKVLKDVAAAYKAAAEDPTAINALSDEIDTKAAAISADALANTPSDVTPPADHPVDTPVPPVADSGFNKPADEPTEGVQYVVGQAPTGAWDGRAGKLATWTNGAWVFTDAPATPSFSRRGRF